MESLLETFLQQKGIDWKVCEDHGIKYHEGKIMYPRTVMLDSADSSEAWKIRDIRQNKHYNQPAGISHKDTYPLQIHSYRTNVVLCEGETDALAVASTDLPAMLDASIWVVPGASSFPAHWAKLLRDKGAAWVAPDNDEAGERLARRVAGLCPGIRRVRPPRDCSDMSEACLKYPDSYLLGMFESAPIQRGDIRLERDSYDRNGPGQRHKTRLLTEVARDTRLQKRGNEYVGRCPFHDERTPSFFVNGKKGYYYCHGCMEKGDIVSYLIKKRGLSFGQAKRYLEER